MTGSSWPTYRTIDGLKVTYTRLWEEGAQGEGEAGGGSDRVGWVGVVWGELRPGEEK